MIRSICFLFFALTSMSSLSAQTCCAAFRDLGKNAFKNGNYAEAIRLYEKGQKCGDATQCSNLAALVSEAKKAKLDAEKPKPNANKTTTPKPPPSKPVAITPSVSSTFKEPTMVFVQGGTFTMGCTSEQGNDCYDNEKPAHQVTLNSFSIGKYEITVGQYLVFCQATGSHLPAWLEKGNDYHVENGKDKYYKDLGYRRNGSENLPIAGVSWHDATAYCQWLSSKTGKSYRLPTEAEWEFAARGGSQSQHYKYSGSNTIGDVAWYDGNSGSKTHIIGQKQGNELKIYDMSGNVWEWCSDFYSNYSSSAVSNPTGVSQGSTAKYKSLYSLRLSLNMFILVPKISDAHTKEFTNSIK